MSHYRIGMIADKALAIARAVGDFTEQPSTIMGKTEHGLIVMWHMKSCQIILHCAKNVYRIKEIRDHDVDTES